MYNLCCAFKYNNKWNVQTWNFKGIFGMIKTCNAVIGT